MQDQLEKLRKIGVREIAKVTKISTNRLEDILEKRFENIQRVRAEGFLNILEREYKVDLSEWLKEYDESSKRRHSEGLKEESQKLLDNLDLDTQKQKDDLKIKRQKRSMSKKQFYFCISIAVILLLAYFGYKSFFIHKLTPQESLSKNKSDDSVVLKREMTNKNQNSLDSLEQDDLQENFELKANDLVLERPKDLQLDQKPILEKSESQNDIKTQTPTLLPIQSSSRNQISQKTQILLKPEKKIWIEIQNLSTHRKDSKIIETPFTIETNKDNLLISLGHGEVSITVGGEVMQYNSASPLRFLYSSKRGLERIKYSQYLKLSGSDESDKISD